MSEYYYYGPSLNEWDGYIAGVFYLENCNFKCHYCHNWRLAINQMVGEKFDSEEILQVFKDNLVDGIVVSGGEPTLSVEKMEDIINITSPYDIKIETNGTNPDVLTYLIEKYPDRIKCIAFDAKAPLVADKYSFTANIVKADVGKIKKSFELPKKYGIAQEFHTTVSKSLLSDFDLKIIGRQIDKINNDATWYVQNCKNDDIFSPEICKKNYKMEEIEAMLLDECFYGEIIYKGF